MIEKICPKCGRHYKAHTIHDSIKCYQCQIVINGDEVKKIEAVGGGYCMEPRYHIQYD